jgi:branched-chain amino acid transport system permease protein
LTELTQFIITGLAVGMIYALIGLGFVLIWKSSSVANLALGQLVLVCSWFTYSMMTQAHLSRWVAVPLVILFAVILGWLIERFILRRLIGQPILSMIAVTLGIAYFLDGIVNSVWPQGTSAFPQIFPKSNVYFGEAVIDQGYIWAAGISLFVFLLLTLFYKYHRMGIAMRAAADDQMAVQACGIPVTSIFSMSWIFACVVAAVGGILISSTSGFVQYSLLDSGLKSFSVVILGGLDSFLGSMVAGPIVGLAQYIGGGYLTPYIWAGFKDILPFFIIMLVVLIKPFGLFGEKRIERI